MRKFIVEREMPNLGNASNQEFRQLALGSNEAIAELDHRIQWVHSYVGKDRTYCVFLAEDEAVVRRHSELTSAPITSVVEVKRILDPTTGSAVARLRT
ncbi:MAG: DUF4242 domain-containing protein [Planctomycetes bacterium]|nr:DUF4242 domain-containing protein [Planctomycetota bacterium]